MQSNDDWGLGWSVAFGATIAAFAIAVYGFATLPNAIPVHWDANGSVSYGSKLTLFLTPVIGAIVLAILRLSANVPTNMINVPVRITPENEIAVRATLRAMLSALGAVLGGGFALLEGAIVIASRSPAFVAFIPFASIGLGAATLAVIATYLVRFSRLR